MNRKALAALSVATLALASCGQKADTTTANTEMDNGGDNSMVAEPNSADVGLANAAGVPAAMTGQSFANAAAASDAFEVESSKLAESASKSASIKAYAKQMIKAHTDSTVKLKKIAAGVTPAITPDPTLTADQQQKLDALKTATGKEFDTAYAADQVAGHQATLDALQSYAASGDAPALKEFASGLTPTVAAHLNMAKALKP